MGEVFKKIAIPTVLMNNTKTKAIACGYSHSFLLTSDHFFI